jgi:thiol-disulfide isomerase/thioredoxin
MKYIKHIIIICLPLLSRAQVTDSIIITGHLKNNSQYAQVIVNKFDVGSYPIASAAITYEKFRVALSPKIQPGVYRFQYSVVNQNDFIDIIIDGKEKNIDFTLDVSSEQRKPVFNTSIENTLWYEWKSLQYQSLQKIQVLASFLQSYPSKSEKIFMIVKKDYGNLVKQYKQKYVRFVNEHKSSWAAKIVGSSQLYFPNPEHDVVLQKYYAHQHFWDGFHSSDTALINTPLYTNLILEYVKYYMDPSRNYSEEEANQGFKKSVDTIVLKFSGHPKCKDMAIRYLSMGFKEIANEEVLQYIDEHYRKQEQCEGDIKDTALAKRLECYNRLKPGMQAPDIILLDANGKNFGIEKLPYDTLVIAFWASWCSNCERQMPELENYIRNHRGIGVLAVSLDTDTAAFYNTIKKYPSLGHTCEFKKWESRAAKDYCIVASPTFIILDKQRRIVGKYPSVGQLLENL